MTSHDCPHCRCDLWEPPHPPATSSPAVRAHARRHLADTIRANREQRGRHTTEETE